MIVLPLEPLIEWLLIFLRVGLMLTLFPIVGDRFVPLRVRIVLAGVMAAALTPVVPVDASQLPSSGGALIAFVVQEALLAAGVGMIGRLMFAIVQFSGQVMGEQMGFGLVNAIDPTGSHQISVVAELQYVLAILVFFVTNLHHPVLRLIAWSFGQLPMGAAVMTPSVTQLMMNLGGVMFALAVGFAMPVIVIVFAINIGLGMIGRAVPQINVFMESFPLRIIAGLSLLMLILGTLANLWLEMFGDMERSMGEVVRLMGGG